MLYDTHAHLNNKIFDSDRDEVIQKIKASGVGLVNNIGACIRTSRESIELSEKYDFIYATCGVHPSETFALGEEDMETLFEMSKHKKVVAIGEIGLDYHYEDGPDADTQKFWFKRQLELAKEVNLPVVIHDRESKGECISILKAMNIKNGVMHCFSGSADTAKELLKQDFFISFTGVVTFKNARKAIETLSVIPLEKLFIETDCPYMAPEPVRGTRNDSSNVIRIAEKYAEVKNIPLEEVIKQTTENARKFFGV